MSAITSNFNGTAIAGGNYLWFNSVTKVSGLPAAGATVRVVNQTISFNGQTLAVPDTTLTFAPTTTAAAARTDYDMLAGPNGTWTTAAPTKVSGNTFLSGLSFLVPAGGIAGGSVKSITWSGDFKSATPGLSVSWQWSAAVYKGTTAAGTPGFTTDESALGVKPLDTATAQYANSDHAGTPECFKQNVTGGARGGGGSNFTGSYSSTKSVAPDNVAAQGTASLSGYVYSNDPYDSNVQLPMAGVTVTLNGFDAAGNAVTQTAVTNASGYYVFTTVPAGSYTITQSPPATFDGTPDTPARTSGSTEIGFVGSLDGTGYQGDESGYVIADVSLAGGDNATKYNFLNFYGIFG